MGRKPTRKELTALAHKELQREQANVLAFAEPRRELEELPEGLETGFVKRRKRGARTDEDCINEICELIAQGITATASTRYVGLPWATWQSWLKKNHQDAREKFEFAYTAHLEVMADNTIRIYEQLKAEREAAMKEFHEAHDHWREVAAGLDKEEKRPPEPIYKGPQEWELSLAEKRVKVRQWHLERRSDKFKSKQAVENTINTSVLAEININDARTAEEAMAAYQRMLNAKPV
jgi:hypothetical protein